MIANAFLATTVICLAALFWLMQACAFLIPYRGVLLHAYGPTLAIWAGVVFVNVTESPTRTTIPCPTGTDDSITG